MNFLQIDRQFLLALKDLQWQDICFAVTHKLIHPLGAVDFAVKVIELNAVYSEAELELASKTEHDSIEDIIRTLDKICTTHKLPPETSDRCLFLALFWLYLNQDKFQDPLAIIESIYADFDYPESIKHLVRYMPSEDGRIIDFKREWTCFLDSSPYRSLFALKLS